MLLCPSSSILHRPQFHLCGASVDRGGGGGGGGGWVGRKFKRCHGHNIYGKNPSKTSGSLNAATAIIYMVKTLQKPPEPADRYTRNWGPGPIMGCSNDDPRLTLTYLRQGQIL